MMRAPTTTQNSPPILLVCGASAELIQDKEANAQTRLSLLLGSIIIGSGLYGASIGLWRSPIQAFYSLIKFPLLICLTCLGTSLINWMLSNLIGAKLSFKEVARSMLLSYSLVSLILGALSPISFFLLYNTPPLGDDMNTSAYTVIKLSHVFAIAFAGIVSNTRLYKTLCAITGCKSLTVHLLIVWMLTHLLMGSQLSWNLRPFIGSPESEVEFLVPDAFEGSFFEDVYHSIITVNQE